MIFRKQICTQIRSNEHFAQYIKKEMCVYRENYQHFLQVYIFRRIQRFYEC